MVLAIQVVLGVLEIVSLVRCHTTYGVECWPWFISFTVNFPASVISAKAVGAVSGFLPFYPLMVVSFLLFVGVGALWWSALIYLVFFLLPRAIRRVRGFNSQPR